MYPRHWDSSVESYPPIPALSDERYGVEQWLLALMRSAAIAKQKANPGQDDLPTVRITWSIETRRFEIPGAYYGGYRHGNYATARLAGKLAPTGIAIESKYLQGEPARQP